MANSIEVIKATHWRTTQRSLPVVREEGVTKFVLTAEQLDKLLVDFANEHLQRSSTILLRTTTVEY